MITNFETNKVYIAKGLSSPLYMDAANSLESAFQDSHVNWEQIPSTHSPRHIWVRDYMPIQVSRNKFIKFRYEPDYLKNNPEYKPDVDSILSELGIDINSNVLLDCPCSSSNVSFNVSLVSSIGFGFTT